MSREVSRQFQPRASMKNIDSTVQHTQKAGSKRDDEMTIAYIKRVLCASGSRDPARVADDQPSGSLGGGRSLRGLLPPLTSSSELDEQLYAFIAVILDNFVHSWYTRISPDLQFTDEVVRIISHCAQALEARLQHVDLLALVLDELPALAIEHIQSKCCAAVRHAATPNADRALLGQRFELLRISPYKVDHLCIKRGAGTQH